LGTDTNGVAAGIFQWNAHTLDNAAVNAAQRELQEGIEVAFNALYHFKGRQVTFSTHRFATPSAYRRLGHAVVTPRINSSYNAARFRQAEPRNPGNQLLRRNALQCHAAGEGRLSALGV
jgi:hypothetical protein